MGVGTTVGFILVAFATSALLAYWLINRKRGAAAMPEEGAVIRLRATSGLYRTRLLTAREDGWLVSAPLAKRQAIPLQVGSRVGVEAPVKGGAYVFRSVVTQRDEKTYDLTLSPPEERKPVERRTIQRFACDEPVRVDGRNGWLVDISTLGAKVKTELKFSTGDRVRVDLADGMIFAWVLESRPLAEAGEWRNSVRLCFETAFEPVWA